MRVCCWPHRDWPPLSEPSWWACFTAAWGQYHSNKSKGNSKSDLLKETSHEKSEGVPYEAKNTSDCSLEQAVPVGDILCARRGLSSRARCSFVESRSGLGATRTQTQSADHGLFADCLELDGSLLPAQSL